MHTFTASDLLQVRAQRPNSSNGTAAPPGNFEDYFCCDCIHAEAGALIIASLGIVASVLLAFPTCGASPKLKQRCFFAGGLSLVVHVFILVAQRAQMPALYLPYLVMCSAFIIVTAVYVGVAVLRKLVDTCQSEGKVYLLGVVLLGTGVSSALVATPVWFEWVVYQAYECMQKRLDIHDELIAGFELDRLELDGQTSILLAHNAE